MPLRRMPAQEIPGRKMPGGVERGGAKARRAKPGLGTLLASRLAYAAAAASRWPARGAQSPQRAVSRRGQVARAASVGRRATRPAAESSATRSPTADALPAAARPRAGCLAAPGDKRPAGPEQQAGFRQQAVASVPQDAWVVVATPERRPCAARLLVVAALADRRAPAAAGARPNIAVPAGVQVAAAAPSCFERARKSLVPASAPNPLAGGVGELRLPPALPLRVLVRLSARQFQANDARQVGCHQIAP